MWCGTKAKANANAKTNKNINQSACAQLNTTCDNGATTNKAINKCNCICHSKNQYEKKKLKANSDGHSECSDPSRTNSDEYDDEYDDDEYDCNKYDCNPGTETEMERQ